MLLVIGVLESGGGGGIRTPGTLSGPTVFKTAGFNRSPTPPSSSLTGKAPAFQQRRLGHPQKHTIQDAKISLVTLSSFDLGWEVWATRPVRKFQMQLRFEQVRLFRWWSRSYYQAIVIEAESYV
jgi:hypothetical protein